MLGKNSREKFFDSSTVNGSESGYVTAGERGKARRDGGSSGDWTCQSSSHTVLSLLGSPRKIQSDADRFVGGKQQALALPATSYNSSDVGTGDAPFLHSQTERLFLTRQHPLNFCRDPVTCCLVGAHD